MWVNQTDVKTCLEMLSEYLWNILGPLSSENSLSCLVTFMVDIVKNGFTCQDYGLNIFLYLLIMMIQYY